jgi:hypothetical protein
MLTEPVTGELTEQLRVRPSRERRRPRDSFFRLSSFCSSFKLFEHLTVRTSRVHSISEAMHGMNNINYILHFYQIFLTFRNFYKFFYLSIFDQWRQVYFIIFIITNITQESAVKSRDGSSYRLEDWGSIAYVNVHKKHINILFLCLVRHRKRLYFWFNCTTMKSIRPYIWALPFILWVSATATHPFSVSVHVVILLLMRLVDSCLFCTVFPSSPLLLPHPRVRTNPSFEHILLPNYTYTFWQIFNQLPPFSAIPPLHIAKAESFGTFACNS